MDYLDEIMEKQENELLKLQTEEYRNFIAHFTNTVDILDKEFYVVNSFVPGRPLSKQSDSEDFDKKFEEAKFQLQQRIDFMRSGLQAVGLRTVQLDTAEIVELLQKTFNPGPVETSKK